MCWHLGFLVLLLSPGHLTACACGCPLGGCLRAWLPAHCLQAEGLSGAGQQEAHRCQTGQRLRCVLLLDRQALFIWRCCCCSCRCCCHSWPLADVSDNTLTLANFRLRPCPALACPAPTCPAPLYCLQYTSASLPLICCTATAPACCTCPWRSAAASCCRRCPACSPGAASWH